MVVSAVDSNSKQSNYGGYAGAGVGAVGSIAGIVKANQFFNPKKEVLTNVKGVAQTTIDTFEQVITPFKKVDIEAVQEEVLQGKDILAGKVKDAFSGLRSEMPNTANFIDEIMLPGKDSLEKMKNVDMGAIREELNSKGYLIREKLSSVVVDLKADMPNTATAIETAMKDGTKNIANIIEYIKATNFAPIEKEITNKGLSVPGRILAALSELKGNMPETQGLVDAVKESIGKGVEGLKKMQTSFDKLDPYIKKLEEKLANKNFTPQSIVETLDGSIKSLKKYHNLTKAGALLLIPAGFGIGKAVDGIVAKVNNNKTAKAEKPKELKA